MELHLKNNKDEADVAAILKRITKMKSGEYLLTVTKVFPARSLDQNAYYWAVPVKVIAEYIGDDEKAADRLIRAACLSETILLPNGSAMQIVGEHKSLTTAEFARFIDRVRVWAKNDHDVPIPAPNEVSDKELIEISERYNSLFY